MAEVVSDDPLAVNPPPKRRRILDPSAIVSVPIYSNKVSSSLRLKPEASLFSGNTNSEDKDDVAADDSLWSQFSSRRPEAAVVSISDSEDEAEPELNQTEPAAVLSPSPPQSPVQKQSRQVRQKISELDRELRVVNSFLSPDPRDKKSARQLDDDEDDDDDVVIVVGSTPQDSPYSSSVREIPLKIRCRTDVHKIPVLSSAPLSDVATRLSVVLNVPPPRLLLLRQEVELPLDATIGELGLGIADIIECVVMAAEESSEDGGSITVRLQSKDRDSSQEFSLHRDAPLGSVFCRYRSGLSAAAQNKLRFHFDGCKVTDGQTPAQLDMEDGDIIEVWT